MIALAFAGALAAATPVQLPPVDRCRDDAAFGRFRSAVEDAVTRKDPAQLRALVADDVRSSFGGDGGWDEFAAAWGLDQPQRSALWTEMQQAMALGCAWTDYDGRVFPGLFEDMGDDADPFELLVIRPGGALRASPDRNAVPRTVVDWASATVVEAPGPDGWVKVTTSAGDSGWIERGFVLSPLGYRLVSEFRGGRWWITAFVAGD